MARKKRLRRSQLGPLGLRKVLAKAASPRKQRIGETLVAAQGAATSSIQTNALVQAFAKECGLKLSPGPKGEVLEVYYHIKRGERNVGYVERANKLIGRTE